MATDKEIVTKFIHGVYDPKGSWNEVEAFAVGHGKFSHSIFDVPDIRGHYEHIVRLRHTYPDLHHTIESVAVADNGHVFVKTRGTGTFKGDHAGVKANGKRFDVPAIWEFELEKGKIVSASLFACHHEINEQLGVEVHKYHLH